jgi:hypothetical protein
MIWFKLSALEILPESWLLDNWYQNIFLPPLIIVVCLQLNLFADSWTILSWMPEIGFPEMNLWIAGQTEVKHEYNHKQTIWRSGAKNKIRNLDKNARCPGRLPYGWFPIWARYSVLICRSIFFTKEEFNWNNPSSEIHNQDAIPPAFCLIPNEDSWPDSQSPLWWPGSWQ